MPPSVPIDGPEIVRVGRFYDLATPADRGAIFDTWRRVRQHGAGTVPVTLHSGEPATMHFFDARDDHGVPTRATIQATTKASSRQESYRPLGPP